MFKGLFDFLKLKYHFKFYSEKRIKKYQFKQIKKLFNYAKRNSSFYYSLYENRTIKRWDDFYKLPIINKKIMMDNLTEINTINVTKEELLKYALDNEFSKNYSGYFKNKYVVGLSSGTSGNKGIYITSKKLTKKLPFVFLARSGIPLSLLPFNILFFLRIYSQGFDDINSKFIKLTYMSTMGNIEKAILKINELNINILMAPPSFIRQIVPYRDSITAKIKLIMTYAEVLTKEEKENFKTKFNCPIIEIYQTSEGQMASACKYGYLHLNEDLVHVELYDEKGKLINNKEAIASRMIITNLVNYSQPLIRYEMNDLVVLKERCECGSKFRVLDGIIGRNDDVIYFYDSNKNKQHIFPDLFARWIITSSDEIKEFKVINNNIGEIEIIIDVLNLLNIKEIINNIEMRIKKELNALKIISFKLTVINEIINLPEDKNKYKRFIRNYDI